MNNTKSDLPLCDLCTKPSDDQEYVGYGMMFCQKCIACRLVKVGREFRLKTTKELSVERIDTGDEL